MSGPVATAIERAYRDEWSRIVSTLIRVTGDWDLAEDCASEAFARAWQRWPAEGAPDNPGAWLTTVARRRALDVLRRRARESDKYTELALTPSWDDAQAVGSAGFGDDQLALIFTCAHPALSLEAQVALTLRSVAGLTTAQIARAFLVTETTMAQRLVRAKARIKHTGIPFRTPSGDALSERVDGILAVIYLIYNEGYAPSDGEEVMDVDVAGEAIRLARLLVRLLPEEPEPRGLLALMLLQHARRDARSVDGDVVTLDRQDRSRWHTAEIAEGLTLLETTMGGGPYVVQAHIQAEHARAARAEDTRWDRIVWLYERLQDHTDSPVVALNHAIAVGFDQGPAAALAALQALVYDRRLQDNFLLPAAQAEFLAQAGDVAGAEAAYAEAIALAPPGPQQRLLERKRSELARRV